MLWWSPRGACLCVFEVGPKRGFFNAAFVAMISETRDRPDPNPTSLSTGQVQSPIASTGRGLLAIDTAFSSTM